MLIARTICAISISCFSIFYTMFFFCTNEDFEHLSMRKGVFVDLLKKYLGMNAGL